MKDEERDKDGAGGIGRQGARAYQAALEAVFAIPIAGGLGYWADTRFGSEPLGLLIGLALGFATFVVRITRMRGLMSGGEENENGRDGR